MENIAYNSIPPEMWEPQTLRIELGEGYEMHCVSAIVVHGEIEGLINDTNKAERWQLIDNGSFLREWVFEGNMDAEGIWPEVEKCLIKRYLDAETCEKMRIAWMMGFPHTRLDAIKEQARVIYESGKMLEYICESCAKSHVGDKTAIKAMILSYAATRIRNSDGIHISLSGSAGTGKSHTGKTVAEHLPKGAVSDARISDKALYYHDIKSNTVLLLDDQELSEDLQELLKVASTDWHVPAKYITVRNQKAESLEHPARCPFWIIKANLNGDEQILDRQLVIWTDESLEQRVSIQNAIFAAAANPEQTGDRIETEISREMWAYVDREVVVIPWAADIECSEHMDARNIKLLIALIQSFALLAAPLRTHDANGYLVADKDDYYAASKLMNPLLQNKGGSQKLKLSSNASRLLDFLKGEPSRIISYDELMSALKMSAAALTQAIHGRKDTQTDGLLAVCPAVQVVTYSTTDTAGSNTRTTSRKALQWSIETYNRWLESAGVFALKT